MRRVFLFTLCILIAFLSTLPLQATQPRQWSVSTQAGFLRGELKGVSVTSDGALVAAPVLKEKLNTTEAFVYSAVVDRAGNVYLGTGNNGKIYRLNSNGQGGEWAKLQEAGVYALAVDSMNRIYAATAPKGRVYRLDRQGGVEVYFDPKEKYLWSLAIDSQDHLFVGTGPKGIIYKVTGRGHGDVFHDTRETHVVTLNFDLDGNLLAGTAPRGWLLRFDSQGSPSVVFESPLDEIKALAVDRYGIIYAAALAPESSAAPESRLASTEAATPQEPSGRRNRLAGTRAAETQKIPGTKKGERLEIYRIDREGLVEKIYTSSEEVAYDLSILDDGNLLVATGNRGRLLAIDRRRYVTFLAQAPEQQLTRILEHKGQIFVCSSSLGKLFQLQAKPPRKGTYESDALDAGMLSSWGVIRWNVRAPSSEGIQFYSRSGNSSKPDSSWSDWQGPYSDPAGSPILSPPTRYLQWKVEFGGKTGAVDSVTATYLQRNMAPEIQSITVHPPGLAFVQTPTSNTSGGSSVGGPNRSYLRSLPRSVRRLEGRRIAAPPRRVYIRGALSVSWQASDPNQDDLLYSLRYRAQGETAWKLLEGDLTENQFTFDGSSFADGTYWVKVVASDQPSNPPESALESKIVSRAFVIANSSPLVQKAESSVPSGNGVIRFVAHTRGSTVHQAEYSVDAGAWKIVFPRDGIADSDMENYEFTLKDLPSGEHTITIRVVDSVGNLGTGKITVGIP